MNELVIEAGKAERHYWADLWRYRELFLFLSWRDILVRYKQTAIGVVWAVLKPVLTAIVLTVVFNKIARMPSNGLPPLVFTYVAMLPWQFFSSALAEASNSLITNTNMISKIYFPRLVIPASAVIVCFVDFLISSAILAFLMLWYHLLPGARVLWLPAFTLLAFLASFGVSLWLAALNVKFRDFRYIVPFIVQIGLYASPVAYPSSLVQERYGILVAHLYKLNPMAGVIDGFRWAIGGDQPLDLYGLLAAMLVTAILLFSGITYFRATEKAFADII